MPRARDFFACDFETRVHRSSRTAEHRGDLRDRSVFDLEQHEDLATIRIELVQDGKKALTGTLPFDFIVLGGKNRKLGRLGDDFFVTPVGPAAVRRRNAHADPVDPSLQRRAMLEVVELAVNDEKDVLAGVMQIRRGNAEVPKAAPDLRRVLVDDAANGRVRGVGELLSAVAVGQRCRSGIISPVVCGAHEARGSFFIAKRSSDVPLESVGSRFELLRNPQGDRKFQHQRDGR